MQGINATLIVQAINFGIAYLILRKLVFEPAVSLVLKERSEEARIQDEVRRASEQNAYEKERLVLEWKAEQATLASQMPELPEELFVLRRVKPDIATESLPDEHEIAAAKKTLVQALLYKNEAKR